MNKLIFPQKLLKKKPVHFFYLQSDIFQKNPKIW